MSIFGHEIQEFIRRVQEQQGQQQVAAAAQQPIPGLTGPRIPMNGLAPGNMPGSMQPTPMGPPIAQIPNPQPGGFAANGPYGQQAMMLAGLLGHRPTPQVPTRGYAGLLGGGLDQQASSRTQLPGFFGSRFQMPPQSEAGGARTVPGFMGSRFQFRGK